MIDRDGVGLVELGLEAMLEALALSELEATGELFELPPEVRRAPIRRLQPGPRGDDRGREVQGRDRPWREP